MTASALTDRYLAEVDRRGVAADALVELAMRPELGLAATSYEGRCMTRPVFLAAAEAAQLAADLANLHAALAELPRRLFGGDLAAFARAAGLTAGQVTAVARGADAGLTRFGRADFYRDASGFRLMEVNLGSTAGGADNPVLNRAFLAHPVVAEFVAAHRLWYPDTMAAMADTLFAECKIPSGTRPLVAAVDWPASFPDLEPILRHSAGLLTPVLELVPCHLGQLSFRGGRVWVHGRPIDVIYRTFLIEDLLDPVGPELIDPVLRAVERGDVRMFTPIDAELYGSKAALAMLSDEVHRSVYGADVLASLDRILPWTRMVRAGSVTVAGELVDLMEYATARQAELVLKPSLLHGGQGVVPGWLVDADEWAARLGAAQGGPIVLQQRVVPVPEPFPAAGGPRDWLLTWGAFLTATGYAGQYVRGSADPAAGVVNMTTGASATCCFHEPRLP